MHFTFLSLITPIISHSWLDCIGLSNHTYTGNDQYYSAQDFNGTCIGYPRGYPGRQNKNINTLYTNQIDGKNKKSNICRSDKIEYSDQFPMTKVQAGTSLKLWWEKDSHTSSTPVSIHIAAKGKQFKQYGQLTQRNKLAEMVFSTAQNCMDINKDNSLCWGHLKLPTLAKGIYSFVWDWQFDKNPVGEDYTSCFEVEII